MARKSKGFVELFWDCPRCGSRNPGLEKVCVQCGAPQPEDVQFYQAEKQELITDAEKLKEAQKGPDIHCPYCGSRNPAGTETCARCGGDLTSGTQREAGRVVGAFKEGKAGTIQCPNCSAENADDRSVCIQCGAVLHSEAGYAVSQPAPVQMPAAAPKGRRSPIALVFLVLFLMVCGTAVIFLVLANRTDSVSGTVDSVRWERSVIIEEQVPVQDTEWADLIPTGAEIISCNQEVRYVQNEPAENSVEVCGTPFTVETGSGAAEVVQDCEYHVMDDYCTYSSLAWEPVDVASVSGADYNVYWPDPEIAENQRLGTREEAYQIFFDTREGTQSFTTYDYNLYQKCQIGTQWDLDVNTFGTVMSIAP